LLALAADAVGAGDVGGAICEGSNDSSHSPPTSGGVEKCGWPWLACCHAPQVGRVVRRHVCRGEQKGISALF